MLPPQGRKRRRESRSPIFRRIPIPAAPLFPSGESRPPPKDGKKPKPTQRGKKYQRQIQRKEKTLLWKRVVYSLSSKRGLEAGRIQEPMLERRRRSAVSRDMRAQRSFFTDSLPPFVRFASKRRERPMQQRERKSPRRRVPRLPCMPKRGRKSSVHRA